MNYIHGLKSAILAKKVLISSLESSQNGQNSIRLGTIQVLRQQKRRVGGVKKWHFLLIYSTVYPDVSGWAKKSQKQADIILEWSLGASKSV